MVCSLVMIGLLPCYDGFAPLLQVVCSLVMIGLLPCYNWFAPLLRLVCSLVTIGLLHCYDWFAPLLRLVCSLVTIGLLPCYNWFAHDWFAPFVTAQLLEAMSESMVHSMDASMRMAAEAIRDEGLKHAKAPSTFSESKEVQELAEVIDTGK